MEEEEEGRAAELSAGRRRQSLSKVLKVRALPPQSRPADDDFRPNLPPTPPSSPVPVMVSHFILLNFYPSGLLFVSRLFLLMQPLDVSAPRAMRTSTD